MMQGMGGGGPPGMGGGGGGMPAMMRAPPGMPKGGMKLEKDDQRCDFDFELLFSKIII